MRSNAHMFGIQQIPYVPPVISVFSTRRRETWQSAGKMAGSLAKICRSLGSLGRLESPRCGLMGLASFHQTRQCEFLTIVLFQMNFSTNLCAVWHSGRPTCTAGSESTMTIHFIGFSAKRRKAFVFVKIFFFFILFFPPKCHRFCALNWSRYHFGP